MPTTITGPSGQSAVMSGGGSAIVSFSAPSNKHVVTESAARADGLVGINGVNIWGDIKEFVTDMEYTDVADGETDSFEITMNDEAEHWTTDWLIDKNTVLNAKIHLQNWLAPGDEQWIDCGTFLCDSIKVSGFPNEVTIKSLTLPAYGSENTQKWENITISAIAEEICSRLGCGLEYYAADIQLESRQQSRQTDVEFLYSVCREYGLGMKVYRNNIVIYNREERDAADPVGTINVRTLRSASSSVYTIEDNQEGTYTGVECTYKPEGSDDESTYTYGSQERVIKLSTSAKSAAEAELKAKAALYNTNIEAVVLRLNNILGGTEPIYSGNNYYFTGLGGYSGKYAVDKVTHMLTSKKSYLMSVEAHAVTLEKDI